MTVTTDAPNIEKIDVLREPAKNRAKVLEPKVTILAPCVDCGCDVYKLPPVKRLVVNQEAFRFYGKPPRYLCWDCMISRRERRERPSQS